MAHSQAPSRANFGSCHLAKCRFKSFDPGVNVSPVGNFSARIISTDVPLMFCWALALLFYLKLLGTSRLGWGIMFGLAFGLGLLAEICHDLLSARGRARRDL